MGVINRTNRIVKSIDPRGLGFCHEIDITIHINGSLTPSSIILGNKGDSSITLLKFHLEELEEADLCSGGLDNYEHILSASNGIELYANYNSDEHISTVSIPGTMLENAGTLQLLYELVEINPPSGNINQKEVFVSNVFSGIIYDTDWNADLVNLIAEAETQDDLFECLTKRNIIIEPDELHYHINLDSLILGNKYDNYITRLTFVDDSDLDKGFVNRYALFKIDEDIYITKFKEISDSDTTMACWVPQVVSYTPGLVKVFIIATTKTNKRWVSNSVIARIQDNFLEEPITPPHQVTITGPDTVIRGFSFQLTASCPVSGETFTWSGTGVNLYPNNDTCTCIATTSGEITIYCRCTGAQASKTITVTEPVTHTVNFLFKDGGWSNNQNLTLTYLDNDNILLSFSAGGSSNFPKYFATGESGRLYSGNIMEIHCPYGILTRIVCTRGKGDDNIKTLNPNTGIMSEDIWTGSSDYVTFTSTPTSGSGHYRIYQLNITYITTE